MGLRLHAARGSMRVGQSQGGLPPDAVVEDEAANLKDTQRLIEAFHDPARHAMQRIVVAPCSPFSVSTGLMRDAGVPVALAVDGSASNDSGHLLAEARLGLLLQRVGSGATAMAAREMLESATLGGARVLSRDDIGALAPGMACELVGCSLDGVSTAGALHDTVAALLLCHAPALRLNVVQVRVRVRDGALTLVELPALVARHNALAARLTA